MNLIKNIFDYSLATVLTLIFAFPMLIIWIIASVETGQNGWFRHQRIGRYGKPFKMYKFRTLKGNYNNSITTAKTHEITRIGKFLNRTKLDELPQLINVLNGTMSFVGPRPDVAGYADELKGDDRIILNVKPGITGPAQIVYKNELDILNQQENPKNYNDKVIWPDKVKINKKYVENWSFWNDLKILWKTIF